MRLAKVEPRMVSSHRCGLRISVFPHDVNEASQSEWRDESVKNAEGAAEKRVRRPTRPDSQGATTVTVDRCRVQTARNTQT